MQRSTINKAKLIRDGRPTSSIKICRPNYYIIGTPKGGSHDGTESLLDAVNEAKAEHDRRAKLDHSHTLKEGKWSSEFVEQNLYKSLQKKLLDEEDVERLEELFYA